MGNPGPVAATAVYRRRRLTALAIALFLGAVAAAVVLLSGDDDAGEPAVTRGRAGLVGVSCEAWVPVLANCSW